MHKVWRGDMPQPLALAQRMIDEAQLPLGQVAEATVDQLGGARGGGAGEIATLHERDAQPPHRRIARDCGAIDPAADYSDVEMLGAQPGDAALAVEWILLRLGQGQRLVIVGGWRSVLGIFLE
jgi:hypothetical protein